MKKRIPGHPDGPDTAPVFSSSTVLTLSVFAHPGVGQASSADAASPVRTSPPAGPRAAPAPPGPPDEHQDRALLRRFVAGEPDAVALVVTRHEAVVRQVASRWFPPGFQRDDAVQDAWAHILSRRHAVDADRAAEFPGWLGTLAHRRCIDLLRQQQRRVARHAPESHLPDHAAPAEHGPDVPLHQDQLGAAVRRFKERLKPAWRTFFELHFVEGLPYADICRRTGWSAMRCSYMKRVLALKARRNRLLMDALGVSSSGVTP